MDMTTIVGIIEIFLNWVKNVLNLLGITSMDEQISKAIAELG